MNNNEIAHAVAVGCQVWVDARRLTGKMRADAAVNYFAGALRVLCLIEGQDGPNYRVLSDFVADLVVEGYAAVDRASR